MIDKCESAKRKKENTFIKAHKSLKSFVTDNCCKMQRSKMILQILVLVNGNILPFCRDFLIYMTFIRLNTEDIIL